MQAVGGQCGDDLLLELLRGEPVILELDEALARLEIAVPGEDHRDVGDCAPLARLSQLPAELLDGRRQRVVRVGGTERDDQLEWSGSDAASKRVSSATRPEPNSCSNRLA